MKAYVLIKVRTGSVLEVVRNLRRLDGVVEAHMTFGPYDVVAMITADNVGELGNVLATNVQPIPGILETMTCLIA